MIKRDFINSVLTDIQRKPPKEEYDKIPVYYCTECLSLKIRTLGDIPGNEYCDECGSTDIDTIDIFNWEKRYRHKYGHKFVNK